MLYSTRKIWIWRLAILFITTLVSKSSGSETEEARLLIAEDAEIYAIDVNTSQLEQIAETVNLGGATAIDYDLERGLIIWSAMRSNKIYSMDMTGEDKKIIAENDITKPDGLSVDWIYGNVYWTDSGTDTINVASLNGKLRKVLFDRDLDKPLGIVVNPLEGWMFWSDRGNRRRIERSGMDGTHRATIISKGITWPNGLCIDTDTRKIYWADAGKDNLQCADYDGSNVKAIILSSPKLVNPYGLDVFEDSVYWSDRNLRSVCKADKVTGENQQTVASGFYSPMGIRILHSSKQPKGTNYCQESGVCSHWCLPAPVLSEDLTYDCTPNEKKFTCACPNGMVLMDNQENCTEDITQVTTTEALLLMATYGGIYTIDLNSFVKRSIANYGARVIDYDLERELIIWSDVNSDKIYSMDMTGADKKIIAENDIWKVEHLSVDWIYGNVYWTDSIIRTINVASLDGKLRKVLFNERHIIFPGEIVVNPLEGWMFWSEYGFQAEIKRSGMDGTHHRTIISEDVRSPNDRKASIIGLSIDIDTRKIYWADAAKKNLKCADYDGSNVKTIVLPPHKLVHPFGLDVFEDSVYWSDWSLGRINRVDKVTGENHLTVVRYANALKDIRVFDSSKQPKGTNFCQGNGVCCSHWCLPAPLISEDLMYDRAPDQKNFTCACPNGMVLMDNQKNCTDDLGLI